ncbi:MAG: hypothetical protein V3S28_02055 [Acidimicrobiia bacterium]
MITTFLSTLIGKFAIATMAIAAAGGGLAATDNLPDPAQQWVSDVVSGIGIDIPAPGDVDLPDQTDGVEVPDAPELPEDAAETADKVVGTVFEGDPSGGSDFGTDVADIASDGKAGNADVADDTQDAGSQADDGADNADVADDYTDGAGDQADDSRP